VALLDPEADERVPQGEVGEIAIRREAGDGGSYWGRPEASMATFAGPWLRTDDLARQDEDGYLWYVGRKDSVIVSAGHRIGPDEVEETLLKHDAVAEVAVVGVPDETRGELVKAFVGTAGAEPSDALADDIQSFAREQLSKHEYPREIEFMDELPKTATGKIDWSPDRRGRSTGNEGVQNSSPASRSATACWNPTSSQRSLNAMPSGVCRAIPSKKVASVWVVASPMFS
jgi:acetyl-CoA synthetase